MVSETIDKLVIQITADVNKALEGIKGVDNAIGNMDRNVDRAAAGVRSATTKMAKSLAMLGAAGGAAAGALGLALTKQAGDMESYMTTLEQLYGSQEKAGEKMEWLLNFAKSTPFEINGLIEATTRLKAYGIEGEEVLGTLGDTASAMGKPIMQAVEALADAQTGEFERLKEFGIKAIQLNKSNAEQFGFTLADVGKTVMSYTDAAGEQRYKEVDRNNREVVTSTLMSIWNEKYAGGMAKQSQTMKGMVSNIKDAMSQAGLAIMGFDKTTGQFKPDSLFEKVKAGVGKVLEFVSNIDFDALAVQITATIDKIVETATTLYTDLAPTWENLKSMFSSLTGILSDVFASFSDSETGTATFVDAINALTEALAAMFKWIDEHPTVTKLIVTITGAAVAFAYIIPIVTAVAGVIGTIIGVIGTLGGVLAGTTTLTAVIGGVIAALGGPITIIIAVIALLAAAWATNLFGIRDKTYAVINKVKEIFGALRDFIADNKERIVTILTLMLGPIGAIILAFRNWDKIKEVVGGIKDWLKTTMSNMADDALNWGKNLITSFIDGIKSKVGAVKEAVSSVSETVSDYLGIHSPAKEGPLSELMVWGPNLTKTFAEGIQSSMADVNAAMQTMVSPSLVAPSVSTAGTTQHLTVNVNIRDTVVREDADIDMISRKVQDSLSSQLRSLSI